MPKTKKVLSLISLFSISTSLTSCDFFNKVNPPELDEEKKESTNTNDDLKDVTFKSESFRYDGDKHYLSVNTLPDNVEVTYIGNGQSSPGEYNVIAQFFNTKTNTFYEKTLSAILTIVDISYESNALDAKLAKITFDDRTIEYSGSSPRVKAENIPDGYDVSYSAKRVSDDTDIEMNDIINADTYIVYAKISKSGNPIYNKTCLVKITPKQLSLSNVYFKSQSFAYNGTIRSLRLTDVNNNEVADNRGVIKPTIDSNGKKVNLISGIISRDGLMDEVYMTVVYSNNDKITAGQHVVNASFYVYNDSALTIENKNYTAPNTISATLTIVDSLAHSVTFINASGQQLLRVDNVLDGASVDESLIPDYIPSIPNAYRKIYDASQLTNIREDKVVTVTYEPNTFNITYVASYGINNPLNPSSYSYEDEDIILQEPTVNDGFRFSYFYYLDENNNEQKIEKISKHSVGDYTIFTKVEALDQNNSRVTVNDKFVTYTGRQVEADVIDNSDGESTYQVYYIDSNRRESTIAPTNVGVYQVRVEVRSTIDGQEIRYKDLNALLVISKQQLTINDDNIFVNSNGGRETLYKDSNGIYSKVRVDGNLVDREYDASSPVSVTLRNVPESLTCSVTYKDYQNNTYLSGVTKAGSYYAIISFYSTDSNYDVPENIIIQIKIATKKITIDGDEFTNIIYPDYTANYRENTTITYRSPIFGESEYSDRYPDFRLAGYFNNSTNTPSDNYGDETEIRKRTRAFIFLTNINENYEVVVGSSPTSDVDAHWYGITIYNNQKCIFYSAKFTVVNKNDTRKVNYVYQSSQVGSVFETELANSTVVVGSTAGFKEVTQDLFNKIYKNEINDNYYWNNYDWVLAEYVRNSYSPKYRSDGGYYSINDYIVSDSDGDLYFLLMPTKKQFKITYVDDTGLIDENVVANLNNDPTKNTHSFNNNISLENVVADTDLYKFVYFYTDYNNPSGSQIKSIDDSIARDLTVYLYAIAKDFTGGKEVVFNVITGDQLTFGSNGQVSNIDTTNFNADAFGNIYVGLNKNFRVYSAPSTIGKRFKGWYTVDSNGKLNSSSLITSTSLLSDEIINNNKKFFTDGKIHLFGVFEEENYNITIDLNNGTSITIENIHYNGHLTSDDRNKITTAVRDACPAGYSNASNTFTFLNETGTSLAILNANFVYSYTRNLVLNVVYKVREINVSFIVPETSANGMGRETVSTITEKHGDNFILPDTINRPGYTFNGWRLNIGGQEQYIYSNTIVDLSTIASNVTTLEVTAVMTLNRYKITLVDSSDSTVDETYINYGDPINVDTFLRTPEKAGYVFEDWYYGNQRLRDAVPGRIYNIDSDIIVYAHYRPKKFNIIFYNGQSILRDLSGYNVQYGQIFSLPTDTGFVTGKELEGYYLDPDFNYKITSSILCVDNADANFIPSSLVDGSGSINIYAKFTPKKYNMTLVMESYTDPYTGKVFRTETVQMEYGVTGNLYKYLTNNYSEMNSYSGPYTAGKVFKSWNVGYTALDMSETNLTYNYDYDIVVTCQYTGRVLGNTTYYWLTENGYQGQTFSGRYDERNFSPKEAVYGNSVSSVTLTSVDAKNMMIDALKQKTGYNNPATDVSISSWYYLKEGEVVDSSKPIDLSQWVLADSDSIISTSQSFTLLCIFTRPSYPITIYDDLEDKQISYQVHGTGEFSIHNNTPYNVEMEETQRTINGVNKKVYVYKYYELFFDELGNRIPNQNYLTFEIVESDNYTFDGRLFRVSASENGRPIEWSFKKIANTTNRYQLSGDYQNIRELSSASLSYLGFSDSSNIIITPIMTEKESISIKFYAMVGSDTTTEVFYHTTAKKNSTYTFPTTTPVSSTNKVFKGWAIWTKDTTPTYEDTIYKDGDLVFQSGTYSTYSDSENINYVAKFAYTKVYISWKIGGQIYSDATHNDIEIDPNNTTGSFSWPRTDIILDHYKYTKFRFTDAEGNYYDGLDMSYNADGTPANISYDLILSKGISRLYIVPDDNKNDYREYIGLTVTYQVKYDDIANGGARTTFYGPFIIDKTEDLSLYNPILKSGLDDLAEYGFKIVYNNPITGGKRYIESDVKISSADLLKLNQTTLLLEGTMVYLNNFTGGTYHHNLSANNNGRINLSSDFILNNNSKLFIPSKVYDITSDSIINITSVGRDDTLQLDDQPVSTNSIVMSNNITSIEEKTFRYFNVLKTIKFSDNLETIKQQAFYNCRLLQNLVFPSSLLTIGNEAFALTYGLESITFNKNLQTIGDYAFFIDNGGRNGNQKLKTLMFNRNLTSIGAWAFAGRKSLTSVYWDELKDRERLNDQKKEFDLTNEDLNYIDGKQITIGDYAFSISYTPGDVIETEGSAAFDGYTQNETHVYNKIIREENFCRIILPRNVRSIGERAFMNRSHTNIVFTDPYNTASDKSLRDFPALTISKQAFYMIPNMVDVNFTKFNIVIPTNVTNIGEEAFRNRVYMSTGIVFNNPNLENMSNYNLTIGVGAFSNCSTTSLLSSKQATINNVFDLTLPNRTRTISDYAFLEVTNINNLKLAENTTLSNLTSIGAWAFGTNYMSSGSYYTTTGNGNDQYLDYINDNNYGWNVVVPASVISIGHHCFYQRSMLKSITFIGGVLDNNTSALTSIGEYAFYSCVNLQYVTNGIGNNLTSLGRYAFARTRSLRGNGTDSTFHLSNKITSIPEGLFYCSGLNNFKTYAGFLDTVGDYAFYHCINLNNFGNATTANYMCTYTVGDYAFAYCSRLKEHNVNSDLTFSGGRYRNSTGSNSKSHILIQAPKAFYRGDITDTNTDFKEQNKPISDTLDITKRIDDYDSRNRNNIVSARGSSSSATCFNRSETANWTTYKRGTQVGVGAFLNCSSFKLLAPVYNLLCVNPYSFAYCTNLTNNDYRTLDHFMPGIFNLSSNNTRSFSRGSDYSTIATYAFYGSNAYVGTDNQNGQYPYYNSGVNLYIYTQDIEAYGLEGLQMRSQSNNTSAYSDGYPWDPAGRYFTSYKIRYDKSTPRVRLGIDYISPMFLSGLGGTQYVVANSALNDNHVRWVSTLAFYNCSNMKAFYINANNYYTSGSEIRTYTPRYINSYAFYGAGITQIILPHGINNYWYNGMVEGSDLNALLTSDKNLDAEDYGKKSDREWISAYAQACEYYPYTGKDDIKYAFGWCTGSLENSKFNLYAYNGSSLTNDNMSLIYSDKHGYETGGKDFNKRKGSARGNDKYYPYGR